MAGHLFRIWGFCLRLHWKCSLILITSILHLFVVTWLGLVGCSYLYLHSHYCSLVASLSFSFLSLLLINHNQDFLVNIHIGRKLSPTWQATQVTHMLMLVSEFIWMTIDWWESTLYYVVLFIKWHWNLCIKMVFPCHCQSTLNNVIVVDGAQRNGETKC